MTAEHPLFPRHITMSDIEVATEDNGDGTVTFTATQVAQVHFGEPDECHRCWPDLLWVRRG